MSLPSAVVHLDCDGFDAICTAHDWPVSHYPEGDSLYLTGLAHALEWFDSQRVKATLFVIARDVTDGAKLELLREAVRRGHAVASHSLTHRRLTELGAAERRRELEESRASLSAALGVQVDGFRAPAFAVDLECMEAIEAAGYRWDSSLFGGMRLGSHSIARTPAPWRPGAALLELPMPEYRPLPLPFHPSYSLVLGGWYLAAGLKLAGRSGAPLVLLLHLTDLAAPLPAARLSGPAQRLFTISHRTQAAKRAHLDRAIARVRAAYSLTTTEALVQAHRREAA